MTRPNGDRPKVGIFTRPIDLGGGSGSHLAHLIEAMAALEKPVDIHLVHHAPSTHPLYERFPQLIVPRNPFQAARVLRRAGFDLLHFAPPTIFTPAWMREVKRVATVHSMEALQIPEHYRAKRRWHDRFVLARYARAMDAVFTVSETSKRFLVQELGIASEKIHLTFNAVSPEFRPLSSEERKAARADVKTRFHVDGPFLFHISLYRRRKNPKTLLEAFARVVQGRHAPPGLKLVIGGRGWDDPHVDALVQRLGLASRVVRTGYLGRDDIVRFLNLASAFVFPTLFEGSGMSNLEAMACKCPVVSTRAGAVPEIVGEAALLVDDPHDAAAFASAIESVLADAAVRERLIASGLERVHRYSWSASARTVVDTYARLCGA